MEKSSCAPRDDFFRSSLINELMEKSTPARPDDASPEEVNEDEVLDVDCPHGAEDGCDDGAEGDDVGLVGILATCVGEESQRACAEEACEEELCGG